ncbi:MAG TPA: UPF0175 family protein [Leptospiraceae bacterium]|nr:UPF0175 family protein [Leptospiraceae bacterium]
MTLIFEDTLLSQIKLSESDIKAEFSIFLYQNKKLTLARAAKLAGMNRIEFQKALTTRQIPIHYSLSDLENDLNTIEQIHKA